MHFTSLSVFPFRSIAKKKEREEEKKEKNVYCNLFSSQMMKCIPLK